MFGYDYGRVQIMLSPAEVWHFLQDKRLSEQSCGNEGFFLTKEQYRALRDLPYTNPNADRLEYLKAIEKQNHQQSTRGQFFVYGNAVGSKLAEVKFKDTFPSGENIPFAELQKGSNAWVATQSPEPEAHDRPREPGQ